MNYIESDSERLSGQLVLKGTRFSVAQLICELADGYTLQDICDDMELDYNVADGALREASMILKEWRQNAD